MNYIETTSDKFKDADRPLQYVTAKEERKTSILEYHLDILRENLSIMGNTISSIIDSSEKLCDFKNETAQPVQAENDEPESIVQTLIKHINKIEIFNVKLSLVDSHLKEVI